MSISVCIPTYRRLDHLREALESIYRQTVPPMEVLIGDDSPDDATQNAIAEETRKSPTPIRYFHHSPSLGQAANVDFLFRHAQGDYIALLHDDDLFADKAMETLHKTLVASSATAAFGKQCIISAEGAPDERSSEALNRDFFRYSSYSGLQRSSLESAIRGQFPNAGYLVKKEAAISASYLKAGEFLDGCDFAFGVLLASQEGSNFCYVDEHTYYYRLSTTSVTRGRIGNMTMMSTYLLEHLDTNDVHAKAAVSEWLSRQGSVSIAEAAAFGMTRDATRWYFSEWHRRKIPTPRGIKRLLRLVMSIGKPPKMECPICRKLEGRGGKGLGARHLHQLMS
jgi:glycosyltransferase involved in cell wall biosynthesis